MGTQRSLNIATLACGIFAFLLLTISSGTNNWKQDIEYYKSIHSYIGLWSACVESKGNIGYPSVGLNCDKDYLRPHLVEPPPWFNSVRALMLLACIGSGLGVALFLVVFVIDSMKKSMLDTCMYWISATVVFIAFLCGLIGLCVFTAHKQHGVQFRLAGGRFYSEYWTDDVSLVRGSRAQLGWSYMLGWGGVVMVLFTLVCVLLSAVVRDVAMPTCNKIVMTSPPPPQEVEPLNEYV